MSVFTSEQVALLAGKLNPDHIKTREVGYGDKKQKLSYIEGWRAIEEANNIFGYGTWSSETFDLVETSRTLVELEDKWKKGEIKHQWRVSYIARVRINYQSLTREGTGFGSGFAAENDIGAAIESAVKEAETDARKRALMTFGNKFGLALYDKLQAGVGYDEDQQPSEAFVPKKGGGYKDASGFTDGKMNSAGKKRAIEDLTNDLNDVTSNFLLDKLWNSWRETVNGWKVSNEDIEMSWSAMALDLFKAKRAELTNTLEAG